jgi:DNA-binding MarR family transcriptional regulator
MVPFMVSRAQLQDIQGAPGIIGRLRGERVPSRIHVYTSIWRAREWAAQSCKSHHAHALRLALIATIAGVAPAPITRLARIMALDQTTLSRNLQLYLLQRLITLTTDDGRLVRVVSLTCEGERALQAAWPLWQVDQARVGASPGQARFEAPLDELAAIRAAVR